MNTNQDSKFRLIDACYPPLSNGVYTLEINQDVISPEKDNFGATIDLQVATESLSLGIDDVFSVYPSNNSVGNFANSIPHIVLNRKSLPWERPFSTEQSTPWLAVICFSEEEQVIESIYDGCTHIDIPLDLFEEIMPRENELKYLTHVRDLNLEDKNDETITQDGFFSIVVGNRFIPSAPELAESELKSTAYLVSLEGFAGYLPEGEKFKSLKNHDYVRLVSLFSWNIYSRTSDTTGFADIMENINVAPYAIQHPLPVFKHGYTPLLHNLRTGEQTVSLYRPPFTPFPVNALEKESYTADGRIIYNPELGIFDMSYAAAWQVGRLMTLQNKPIAVHIFNWRRGIRHAMHKLRANELLCKQTSAFTDESDFLTALLRDVCIKLVKNEAVAPIATDRRNPT